MPVTGLPGPALCTTRSERFDLMTTLNRWIPHLRSSADQDRPILQKHGGRTLLGCTWEPFGDQVAAGVDGRVELRSVHASKCRDQAGFTRR